MTESRPDKNNIVSLSGGKDSTAMLLMMLERGEPVHSVVFFDTGWEFPEMHDHIDRLESFTGIDFVRLKSDIDFNELLHSYPVKAGNNKNGKIRGKVYRFGHGWPAMNRRWCTYFKVERTLYKYFKSVSDAVVSTGFAKGEEKRINATAKRAERGGHFTHRYPLIEYGITEPKALKYCLSKGFDWDGLYNVFDRVSCFCCPLGGIRDARRLRKHYPELWERVLEMDSKINDNRGYTGYKTAHDLEKRFVKEDRQMEMFA